MWAALPAIASTFADTLDGAIRVVDRRRQCARVCAVLGGGGQKSMIANVVKARRRYQGSDPTKKFHRLQNDVRLARPEWL